MCCFCCCAVKIDMDNCMVVVDDSVDAEDLEVNF